MAKKPPTKTIAGSSLVLCAFMCAASAGEAQTPVGALAIDERQGDQWGWAVNYETTAAAQAAALGECGHGCSVVLTFGRCAAYAADQDANSTAVGWAMDHASSDGARRAALAECRARGGFGCILRAWGCNGPAVEEALRLDRPARRQIQRGLQAAGFDPGGADGLFGPRTRAAIRRWQTSRGARATGYLDRASVAALRPSPSHRGRSGTGQTPPRTMPARCGKVRAQLSDRGSFESPFAAWCRGSLNPLLAILERGLPLRWRNRGLCRNETCLRHRRHRAA